MQRNADGLFDPRFQTEVLPSGFVLLRTPISRGISVDCLVVNGWTTLSTILKSCEGYLSSLLWSDFYSVQYLITFHGLVDGTKVWYIEAWRISSIHILGRQYSRGIYSSCFMASHSHIFPQCNRTCEWVLRDFTYVRLYRNHQYSGHFVNVAVFGGAIWLGMIQPCAIILRYLQVRYAKGMCPDHEGHRPYACCRFPHQWLPRVSGFSISGMNCAKKEPVRNHWLGLRYEGISDAAINQVGTHWWLNILPL